MNVLTFLNSRLIDVCNCLNKVIIIIIIPLYLYSVTWVTIIVRVFCKYNILLIQTVCYAQLFN